MITGKLNLAKLEHFITNVKNKAGEPEECIIIPIKRNSLFRTDKGNVFIDIAAFETPIEKRKIVDITVGDKTFKRYESTHIVSQSFDPKKREEMKKAGQYAPTLGNLSDSDKQLDSSGTDAANTSQDFAGDVGDDLPF